MAFNLGFKLPKQKHFQFFSDLNHNSGKRGILNAKKQELCALSACICLFFLGGGRGGKESVKTGLSHRL